MLTQDDGGRLSAADALWSTSPGDEPAVDITALLEACNHGDLEARAWLFMRLTRGKAARNAGASP